MSLVSTQREELDQLKDQLENIRTTMGNNAIWKDEAINKARQMIAKTIDVMEDSVEQLTKELAKTKERLVTAQTIDLEVHTRENTQRKQLQAKLTQEKQTIVRLKVEVEHMKTRLEEIRQTPLVPPNLIHVPFHIDEEQLRRMEQENQEHQKTIDLMKREVHKKDQRFWEEEANAPHSTNPFRTYETQKDLFLFLYDYRSG